MISDIRWTCVQTVAPTVEPVTLTEARAYLRINEDDTTQDDHIEDVLIPAARLYVEAATKRQLITATYRLRLTHLPDVILLPRVPNATVTSFAYLDSNGDAQTLASSVYEVFSDAEPSEVQRAYNQNWPTYRSNRPTSITITFTAGYGAAATNVPADFKRAILGVVSTLYEFREDVVTGTIKSEIPESVDRFLRTNEFRFDKPWRVGERPVEVWPT